MRAHPTPRCSACGAPYRPNDDGTYRMPCTICARLFELAPPAFFDAVIDWPAPPAEKAPEEASAERRT